MKTVFLLPVLLLCAACVPFSGQAPIETTPDRAYACAAATLNSMGYMIVDADERHGTIKADRATHAPRPFGPRVNLPFASLGVDEHDVIWVAVSEERSTHQPTLYVTGDTMALSDGGVRAGGMVGRRRSREVESDSKALLSHCGVFGGEQM